MRKFHLHFSETLTTFGGGRTSVNDKSSDSTTRLDGGSSKALGLVFSTDGGRSSNEISSGNADSLGFGLVCNQLISLETWHGRGFRIEEFILFCSIDLSCIG